MNGRKLQNNDVAVQQQDAVRRRRFGSQRDDLGS